MVREAAKETVKQAEQQQRRGKKTSAMDTSTDDSSEEELQLPHPIALPRRAPQQPVLKPIKGAGRPHSALYPPPASPPRRPREIKSAGRVRRKAPHHVAAFEQPAPAPSAMLRPGSSGDEKESDVFSCSPRPVILRQQDSHRVPTIAFRSDTPDSAPSPYFAEPQQRYSESLTADVPVQLLPVRKGHTSSDIRALGCTPISEDEAVGVLVWGENTYRTIIPPAVAYGFLYHNIAPLTLAKQLCSLGPIKKAPADVEAAKAFMRDEEEVKEWEAAAAREKKRKLRGLPERFWSTFRDTPPWLRALVQQAQANYKAKRDLNCAATLALFPTYLSVLESMAKEDGGKQLLQSEAMQQGRPPVEKESRERAVRVLERQSGAKRKPMLDEEELCDVLYDLYINPEREADRKRVVEQLRRDGKGNAADWFQQQPLVAKVGCTPDAEQRLYLYVTAPNQRRQGDVRAAAEALGVKLTFVLAVMLEAKGGSGALGLPGKCVQGAWESARILSVSGGLASLPGNGMFSSPGEGGGYFCDPENAAEAAARRGTVSQRTAAVGALYGELCTEGKAATEEAKIQELVEACDGDKAATEARFVVKANSLAQAASGREGTPALSKETSGTVGWATYTCEVDDKLSIEFRVALVNGGLGLQRKDNSSCKMCNKLHNINKKEDRRTLEGGGEVKIKGRPSKHGPASTVRWSNFTKAI